VDPLVPSITVPLTYYTTWYNAFVGGKTYPAQNSAVATFAITTSTYVYEQYVFPGLTVTSLTPGQLIVMVLSVPPIGTESLISELDSIASNHGSVHGLLQVTPPHYIH